jgi:hypothetical protein
MQGTQIFKCDQAYFIFLIICDTNLMAEKRVLEIKATSGAD